MARVHEHPLDGVLDVVRAGDPLGVAALEVEADDARELLGEEAVLAPHGLGGAVDGVRDEARVEGDDAAVALAHLREAPHVGFLSFSSMGRSSSMNSWMSLNSR